jgi:hypothetical protein
MPEKKYITVNGVMKRNPAYVEPGNSKPQDTSSLAVVSSLDDVMVASDVQSAHTGISVPMSESTAVTVDMLQDDEILAKYKSRLPLDGANILEQLGQKFARYEVPLGMVNKLMMLTNYKLDFLVDDSGSMSNATDVEAIDATEPVKTLIRGRLGREPKAGDKMSRLEEAEDRLHIMAGILAYIPVEYMQVRFLNDRKPLVLNRTDLTPEEFETQSHDAIRKRFAGLRLGSTPVRDPLQTGFDYPGIWSHYLFNDGEPNEGGRAIADQIIRRKKPEDHCLTLLSCTNQDEETAWMKLVDSQATYVAELDDYQDEKAEVAKKQGIAFPFSRGLWILNQLVASFNPYDLDALDENLPLTRSTLNNILGRQLNPREYQYYFERNPNASLYLKEYESFLNQEVFGRQIITTKEQDRREKAAGYIDGERPNRPIPDISRNLTAITEEAYKKFAAQYPAEPAPFAAAPATNGASATVAARSSASTAPGFFMASPPAYSDTYELKTESKLSYG